MFPPNPPPSGAGLPMAPQPPVQPPQDPMANPLVTITMTPDQAKEWQTNLKLADERRKVFEPSWERNLAKYAPNPTDLTWGETINVGVDFYQTEQKKDQLFFDTPTVILTPEDDSDPSLAAQISKRGTLLNRKIGRKGLDLKRLMDKVNVDIICPAGQGWIKVGVTRITKDVPMLHPPNHPTMPGQPQMDPQGQPITAPVPVYQKIFAERSSPKTGLIPDNFHDTEFDKAPWLGVKFAMPTKAGVRQLGLPPDFEPKKTASSDDQVFVYEGVKPSDPSEQITGQEVWYRAYLYDDAVYHPDHLRQLVFIDGIEEPVVHRDSPYQTFQNGLYMPDAPDGMVGFPIHVITVRDLPDSAYPPSDCTITRPLVSELNRFRTQLVEQRDSATSIRIADEKVVTPEVMAKVIHGPWGTIIPIANFDPGRPPVMEIAHPTYSRDNFQSQEIIERDLAKLNTLGSNQTGSEANTTHSATEMTYIQRNSDVRMQAERNRISAGFLGLVSKIDALMAKFETPPGQEALSGYTFDIKPDSGMHVDAASDRKFAIDRLNILAKSPIVNQEYLMTELSPDLRLDASKLIKPPPPPQAAPPKTSLIIKGDDVNPLSPQYTNMVQILNEIGVKVTAQPITPDMITNAALSKPLKPITPSSDHGGAADKADKVNQHTADLSGKTPNFGGQAGAH